MACCIYYHLVLAVVYWARGGCDCARCLDDGELAMLPNIATNASEQMSSETDATKYHLCVLQLRANI